MAELGEVVPVTDYMHTHPNCRCVMSPVLKSWDELGYPEVTEAIARGEVEPPLIGDTGEQRLRRMPRAQQQRILGKARWNLWSGAQGRPGIPDNFGLTLGQLTVDVPNPDWGWGLRLQSLDRLLPQVAQQGPQWAALAQQAERLAFPWRFTPVSYRDAREASYADAFINRENVEAQQQRIIDKVAAVFPDTTLADLPTAIEARMQSELADSEVRIRVPEHALDRILEDGRLKSHAEVGRGTTPEGLTQRTNNEAALFGIPDDAPRPIYGYIAKNDADPVTLNPYGELAAAVPVYGDVVLRLKDDIKGRTTVTWVDSFAAYADAEGRTAAMAAHPYLRPDWRAFPSNVTIDQSPSVTLDALLNTLVNANLNPSGYAEAHIHGGVTLSDIAEVVLPPAMLADEQSPGWMRQEALLHAQLVARLTELGIPVRIERTSETGLRLPPAPEVQRAVEEGPEPGPAIVRAIEAPVSVKPTQAQKLTELDLYLRAKDVVAKLDRDALLGLPVPDAIPREVKAWASRVKLAPAYAHRQLRADIAADAVAEGPQVSENLVDYSDRIGAHWVQYEQRFEYVDQFVEKNGAALNDAIEAELRALTAPSEVQVVVRVPGDVIDDVLREGAIKTQFETQSSMGYFGPSTRARFENRAFGIPMGADPRSRPVYGVLVYTLDPANEDADYYGDVTVVLKDSVRDRTTFTMGDSLDGVVQPTPLNEPGIGSFMHDSMTLSPLGLGRARDGVLLDPDGALSRLRTSPTLVDVTYINYAEAQVHGGVTLADVERMVFKAEPHPTVKRLLRERGIEWRVQRQGVFNARERVERGLPLPAPVIEKMTELNVEGAVFVQPAWETLPVPERKAAFGALPTRLRDKLADAKLGIARTVESLLVRAAPRESPLEWQRVSKLDAVNDSVLAQVERVVQAGLISRESGDAIGRIGIEMASALSQATTGDGLLSKMALRVVEQAVEDSLAQEVETSRRVLGDHGARHLEGNARMAVEVLAAVPGHDTPADVAMMWLAAALHDTGYLAAPARAFLDEDHGRWSAQHFRQHYARDLTHLFDADFVRKLEHLIETHSDATLDWANDPELSAFRLADNLALFHEEKLPNLFHLVPKNTRVLIDYAHGRVTLAEAKRMMRENVATSKLADVLKLQLQQAVEEVGETLPRFTLGMIAGAVGDITWRDDHVHVELIHNPANEALGEVLDLGQKQFEKFAKTYGEDPSDFVAKGSFTLATEAGPVLSATIKRADPVRLVAERAAYYGATLIGEAAPSPVQARAPPMRQRRRKRGPVLVRAPKPTDDAVRADIYERTTQAIDFINRQLGTNARGHWTGEVRVAPRSELSSVGTLSSDGVLTINESIIDSPEMVAYTVLHEAFHAVSKVERVEDYVAEPGWEEGPSELFTQTHIVEYAKAIGLDPSEVLAAIDVFVGEGYAEYVRPLRDIADMLDMAPDVFARDLASRPLHLRRARVIELVEQRVFDGKWRHANWARLFGAFRTMDTERLGADEVAIAARLTEATRATAFAERARDLIGMDARAFYVGLLLGPQDSRSVGQTVVKLLRAALPADRVSEFLRQERYSPATGSVALSRLRILEQRTRLGPEIVNEPGVVRFVREAEADYGKPPDIQEVDAASSLREYAVSRGLSLDGPRNGIVRSEAPGVFEGDVAIGYVLMVEAEPIAVLEVFSDGSQQLMVERGGLTPAAEDAIIAQLRRAHVAATTGPVVVEDIVEDIEEDIEAVPEVPGHPLHPLLPRQAAHVHYDGPTEAGGANWTNWVAAFGVPVRPDPGDNLSHAVIDGWDAYTVYSTEGNPLAVLSVSGAPHGIQTVYFDTKPGVDEAALWHILSTYERATRISEATVFQRTVEELRRELARIPMDAQWSRPVTFALSSRPLSDLAAFTDAVDAPERTERMEYQRPVAPDSGANVIVRPDGTLVGRDRYRTIELYRDTPIVLEGEVKNSTNAALIALLVGIRDSLGIVQGRQRALDRLMDRGLVEAVFGELPEPGPAIAMEAVQQGTVNYVVPSMDNPWTTRVVRGNARYTAVTYGSTGAVSGVLVYDPVSGEGIIDGAHPNSIIGTQLRMALHRAINDGVVNWTPSTLGHAVAPASQPIVVNGFALTGREVHATFATPVEGPHDVPFPEGWSWRDTGPRYVVYTRAGVTHVTYVDAGRIMALGELHPSGAFTITATIPSNRSIAPLTLARQQVIASAMMEAILVARQRLAQLGPLDQRGEPVVVPESRGSALVFGLSDMPAAPGRDVATVTAAGLMELRRAWQARVRNETLFGAPALRTLEQFYAEGRGLVWSLNDGQAFRYVERATGEPVIVSLQDSEVDGLSDVYWLRDFPLLLREHGLAPIHDHADDSPDYDHLGDYDLGVGLMVELARVNGTIVAIARDPADRRVGFWSEADPDTIHAWDTRDLHGMADIGREMRAMFTRGALEAAIEGLGLDAPAPDVTLYTPPGRIRVQRQDFIYAEKTPPSGVMPVKPIDGKVGYEAIDRDRDFHYTVAPVEEDNPGALDGEPNTIAFFHGSYDDGFIIAYGEHGGAVGVVHVEMREETIHHVKWVKVHRDYRRRGIATRMYEFATLAGLDIERGSGQFGLTGLGALYRSSRISKPYSRVSMGISRMRPDLTTTTVNAATGSPAQGLSLVHALRSHPTIAEAERSLPDELRAMGVEVLGRDTPESFTFRNDEGQLETRKLFGTERTLGHYEDSGEPSMAVELNPALVTLDDIDLAAAYSVRRNLQDAGIVSIVGDVRDRLKLDVNGTLLRVDWTDRPNTSEVWDAMTELGIPVGSIRDQSDNSVEVAVFARDDQEMAYKLQLLAEKFDGTLTTTPAHVRWYFYDADARNEAQQWLNAPADAAITADDVKKRLQGVDERTNLIRRRNLKARRGEGPRRREAAESPRAGRPAGVLAPAFAAPGGQPGVVAATPLTRAEHERFVEQVATIAKATGELTGITLDRWNGEVRMDLHNPPWAAAAFDWDGTMRVNPRAWATFSEAERLYIVIHEMLHARSDIDQQTFQEETWIEEGVVELVTQLIAADVLVRLGMDIEDAEETVLRKRSYPEYVAVLHGLANALGLPVRTFAMQFLATPGRNRREWLYRQAVESGKMTDRELLASLLHAAFAENVLLTRGPSIIPTEVGEETHLRLHALGLVLGEDMPSWWQWLATRPSARRMEDVIDRVRNASNLTIAQQDLAAAIIGPLFGAPFGLGVGQVADLIVDMGDTTIWSPPGPSLVRDLPLTSIWPQRFRRAISGDQPRQTARGPGGGEPPVPVAAYPVTYSNRATTGV